MVRYEICRVRGWHVNRLVIFPLGSTSTHGLARVVTSASCKISKSPFLHNRDLVKVVYRHRCPTGLEVFVLDQCLPRDTYKILLQGQHGSLSRHNTTGPSKAGQISLVFHTEAVDGIRNSPHMILLGRQRPALCVYEAA